MEEKNLASEMLSTMKKAVGTEKAEPEKKIKKLPGDDSLFEFDFDEVKKSAISSRQNAPPQPSTPAQPAQPAQNDFWSNF